jgi:DNA-binding GntR family transcriptional regulator
VGDLAVRGIDWIWQVSKYVVHLSPEDPCRATIWYRGFEYWAARNVTKANNYYVSGHTAERILRRLAQEGYLVRENRGPFVAFRPSPKLCEYIREHLEELRKRVEVGQKTNI